MRGDDNKNASRLKTYGRILNGFYAWFMKGDFIGAQGNGRQSDLGWPGNGELSEGAAAPPSAFALKTSPRRWENLKLREDIGPDCVREADREVASCGDLPGMPKLFR
jgi:hypothetical protein